MDDMQLARTVHLLAVIIWIGGMSMATSVVLTAVRRGELGSDPVRAFQAIEKRFVWQARIAAFLVGLSGFYMVVGLDLWSRFGDPSYWWMHAMTALWLLFALVLFVAEPLILHRYFENWARREPARAFARLQRVHWLLLVLSIITAAAAALGSHGAKLE